MKRVEADALKQRSANTLAKLTVEQWRSYAGKVLAIDPRTDAILDVGKSEAELEGRLKNQPDVIEFFHVPQVGSFRSA